MTPIKMDIENKGEGIEEEKILKIKEEKEAKIEEEKEEIKKDAPK